LGDDDVAANGTVGAKSVYESDAPCNEMAHGRRNLGGEYFFPRWRMRDSAAVRIARPEERNARLTTRTKLVRRNPHMFVNLSPARRLGLATLFASVVASPPSHALSYTCSAPGTLQNFTDSSSAGSITGTIQSYVVPAGVGSVTIDAAGAQGGNATANLNGVAGKGAEVAATIPVTAGDTLCMALGIRGANASLAGGAGGGTFVYAISSGTCASNLASVSTGSTAPYLAVAAGGGGGGGGTSPNAGNPGLATGLAAGTAGALAGSSGNNTAGAGGSGGNGGSASGGGGGGGLLTNGGSGICSGGQSLVNGASGAAGCASGNAGAGGFGGGGAAGGGGGYNGGGGNSNTPAGGGGGGSYSSTAPVFAQDGLQSGNGAVNLCVYPTLNVTPSATGPGSITPNTAQNVPFGGSQQFTVTPNAGANVTMGGSCGGNLVGNTYTTNAIAASCTVTATFALNSFSGASPTGTGTVSANFTGGGASCTFTSAQLISVTGNPASPPGPAPATFPHGLFTFTLAGCTPGSTITMTMAYPATLPAGTQYWKYGPTAANPSGQWYVLPATITGSTVVFSITDGGLGDDDLAANGTIADQGGPGNPGPPGSPTAIPTLSEWALLAMASLLLLSGIRRTTRRARPERRTGR
jgi:hypothetical protein